MHISSLPSGARISIWLGALCRPLASPWTPVLPWPGSVFKAAPTECSSFRLCNLMPGTGVRWRRHQLAGSRVGVQCWCETAGEHQERGRAAAGDGSISPASRYHSEEGDGSTPTLDLHVMLRTRFKDAGGAFLCCFISGLAALVTRSMAMNKRTT